MYWETDGDTARSSVIATNDECGVTEHPCQDYAISIATIHHLATPERRKKAIQVRIKILHKNAMF
jgi:hypothetical protein